MTDNPQDRSGDALQRAMGRAEAGLAAEQPHVPDWAGPVRRRLRRRRAAAAGAAVAVALGLVGAAATAIAGPDRADSLVAAAPSDSPTLLPSASAAPLPEPKQASPTLRAAASAPPAPPTEPVPVPQGPQPQADLASSEPAYPPYGSQDIVLTARVSDARPQVGQEITVEVVATGRAEHEPFLQGPRIDDSGPGWIAGSCAAPGDPSPPPAREQRVAKTVRHTFDEPGRHTMEFRADSACSYYRGSDQLTVVIDVQPASPPPSPASTS